MSGARVVLHLALELKRRGGGVGAAALCGGGGQGDALIVEGSLCLSTSRPVDDLVARARDGEARAVARLISLVEDGSPQLREVMAALAPYAGAGARRRAHRLARASASRRRPARWSARCAPSDKRVGVLAVDPSSPFSGGALLGDRVRMQDHALDDGRLHPLDGLARPPRRPRLGDAAGAAGARRRRLRRGARRDRRRRAERGRGRRPGRHHRRAAGARDGRRHPGGEGRHPRDRRRLRRQQGRPRRRRPDPSRPALDDRARPTAATDAWRPPIVSTVAPGPARASTSSSRALGRAPRLAGGATASSQRRRTARARDEIEAIALTALRDRLGRPQRRRRPRRRWPPRSRPARPTRTPPPTGCSSVSSRNGLRASARDALVGHAGTGQPRPRSLPAPDWAGSGRRIMRNAMPTPTHAASSETSKATWSARSRASVLMLRISSWTASGWSARSRRAARR